MVWSLRQRPDWSATADCYRPDPAALVFRTPSGVLTLGHSREDLLAAQDAGWKVEGFVIVRGTWSETKGGYTITNPAQVYRLAPGQIAWPVPEAKPEAPRFAVGQVWERRDGERVTIKGIYPANSYAVRAVTAAGSEWGYDLTGCWIIGQPTENDLIRLVSEPEAAAPWPREKRALAAGLRVQCRCAGTRLPWHTIEDSTKHLLQGDGGGSWADPNYAFRVHPDDEEKMQAIERGEQVESQATTKVSDKPACISEAITYAEWLAARPARLAARKPIAVSAARFNAFRDRAGWTSQSRGPVEDMLPRVQKDRFPVHNPDARMATVPVGHEKGMP